MFTSMCRCKQIQAHTEPYLIIDIFVVDGHVYIVANMLFKNVTYLFACRRMT